MRGTPSLRPVQVGALWSSFRPTLGAPQAGNGVIEPNITHYHPYVWLGDVEIW